MEAIITEILKQSYNWSIEKFRQLQGGNWGKTYQVSVNSQDFIIKVLEQQKLPVKQEIILELLVFLHSQGIIVREPIPDTSNKLIIKFDIDNSPAHLLCYRKIPGTLIERDISLLTPTRNRKLGTDLAQLHLKMLQFTKTSLFNQWTQQENLFYDNYENDSIPSEILDRYQRFLKRIVKKNLKLQPIHGDLHFANLVLLPDSTSFGFFDFDDIILGHPLMDLAILILDYSIVTLASDVQVIQDFVIPLLSGYSKARIIPLESLKLLPEFLKLLELSLYIQCFDIRDSQAIWVHNFYLDREKSVKSDEYIILNPENILEIYNKERR